MLTRFGRRIAATVVTTGLVVGLCASPADAGKPPCDDTDEFCVGDNAPGGSPPPVPGGPGAPSRPECVAAVGVLDDAVCPEHATHGAWDAGHSCWVKESAGNSQEEDPLWKDALFTVRQAPAEFGVCRGVGAGGTVDVIAVGS